MKTLKKMLLIHWYTYDRELIEFGKLNFLTGKTAAGKSTIIDALQLVLLGDTNGNYFNKAANEKSVRTLKSYLFGENGDDGETGFNYLRCCTFSSYVILEFEDTEKKSSFIAGIVCDCYEDLHYDYKWIVGDRMGIPDDMFTDPKTNTPYTIAQLKSLFRKQGRKNVEIIDTNKRYQEVLLAKYGSLKRKYLTLLKKSVPFSPISDIEKFITESICDVKNNIEVEQMQSDIRQYKNLEADAIRTEERVKALTGIAEASRVYEADKDRYEWQSYIILRADEEEQSENEKKAQKEADKYREVIRISGERMDLIKKEMETLEAEIYRLEEEYHTSDLAKKQKDLSAKTESLKEEITGLANGLRGALNAVKSYGKNISVQIKNAVKAGFDADTGETEYFESLEALAEADLAGFDFNDAAARMEHFHENIREYEYQLKVRAQKIRESIRELSQRIDNLRKGIKPYPDQVTALKRRLESGIFARFKKAVEIPIFAELLEIRDAQWRDAIEGYLDNQRFNLMVPEEYFQAANEIYDQIKKEEKVYGVGLVDI
ncbi:MAG: ATP-binding protein, partial [Lachnospiraceae bacterium]|nr:ATP-binding protein [Lachnospiraceae bacterium]